MPPSPKLSGAPLLRRDQGNFIKNVSGVKLHTTARHWYPRTSLADFA
jgi:hypothetical protein